MIENEGLQGPDMPGDADGPVFLEPWHAEAFSLAVALHRQGAFSWSEWVEHFSTTLRDVPAAPGETVEAAYYRRWLLALETISARKRLASAAEMAERKEEWRRAYLQTPHGQPVKLHRARGLVEPHDNHHHAGAPHPEPAAVSAARAR
jgi:nitrile hydratase accessory protein